jgi:hypothetical protein
MLKEMKKVLLFCVVALAFASCKKTSEQAPATDSAAVDTAVVVDTTAVDTTKADTAVVK